MPLSILKSGAKREALALGVLLTGFQIGVACALAPGDGLIDSYSRLCTWDCAWYENIAREGYHSTLPPTRQNMSASNVAFFPAYPALGSLLHRGAGLSTEFSLLAVAQLFCVVFWTALWMLLRKWRIPRLVSALVVLAVLAHPASIFLVSGYSESLFLSSLLLFILYPSAPVAGFSMSASRIIGIPAAGFPILRQLSKRLCGRRYVDSSELLSSFNISLVAASGGILFLAYCQARFSRFDLYMETQRIGWGVMPDYGAILKWRNFRFMFPIDRVATFASGAAFVGLAGLEALASNHRARTGFSRRLPVYLTALFFFFITLSGLKSVAFLSMIRYTLPWYILLILCAAHLSLRLPRAPKPVVLASIVWIAAGLFALYYWVQLPSSLTFLNGKWFA